MLVTPEQEQIGRDNFHEAVGYTRRGFLATAGVVAGGALPSVGKMRVHEAKRHLQTISRLDQYVVRFTSQGAQDTEKMC